MPTATELEYSRGDVHPLGAPDGVINIQDLLLLQQLALGQGAGYFVENLNLLLDGPATISAAVTRLETAVYGEVGGLSSGGGHENCRCQRFACAALPIFRGAPSH